MSNDTLAGRTALVTGGGVGIGRGIAIALARAGVRTAVTYRTHEPDAELLDALAATGHEPFARPLDATDEAAVQAFAAELREEFGALDILVNNAGGMIRRAPLPELDADLWRQVMAVNLDSAYYVTRAVQPFLSDGRGRIVNVASLAGHNGGGPGATAYATSKAAVFGLTKGLARELAPQGITVNALAPGFIDDTPFHETFTADEARKQIVAGIPVGRPGVPADCAGAVLWLASDAAGFVTGTIIDINGGVYVR